MTLAQPSSLLFSHPKHLPDSLVLEPLAESFRKLTLRRRLLQRHCLQLLSSGPNTQCRPPALPRTPSRTPLSEKHANWLLLEALLGCFAAGVPLAFRTMVCSSLGGTSTRKRYKSSVVFGATLPCTERSQPASRTSPTYTRHRTATTRAWHTQKQPRQKLDGGVFSGDEAELAQARTAVDSGADEMPIKISSLNGQPRESSFCFSSNSGCQG